MQSEDDQLFGELGHVVELARSFVSEARTLGSGLSTLQFKQVDRVRGGMLNLYDLLELILDDDTLNQEFLFLDFEGEQKMSLLNLDRWKEEPLASDDPYINSITQDMLNDLKELTGKHPRAIAGLLAIADRKEDGPARKRSVETLFFEPGEYDPIVFPEKPPERSDDDLIYISNDGSRPDYSLAGQWWPERERRSEKIFQIFNAWRSERGAYLARKAKQARQAELARKKLDRMAAAA